MNFCGVCAAPLAAECPACATVKSGGHECLRRMRNFSVGLAYNPGRGSRHVTAFSAVNADNGPPTLNQEAGAITAPAVPAPLAAA